MASSLAIARAGLLLKEWIVARELPRRAQGSGGCLSRLLLF